MNKYTNEYVQSTLSLFSYLELSSFKEVLFEKDLTTDAVNSILLNIISDSLKDDFFSLKSTVDFFAEHFEIINQKSSITNGFSATTYRLKKAIEGSDYTVGELFVSYRGTEPLDGRDWLTDIGLSLSSRSFLGMFKLTQESDAIDYLDDILKDTNYTGTKINISGHSLGGYLAARTYYYTNETDFLRIGDVSTFNGAGFSGLFIPFIDSAKRTEYSSKITNYYSFRGFNVTAGNFSETSLTAVLDGKGTVISTFQHLGPRVETYTENAGGLAGNHSVAMLVKTMGIYSILEKIVSIPSNVASADISSYQIKAFNKLMMQTIPSNKDFGIAYEKMIENLIKMFNIPSNLTESYSTWTAKFISLKDYFNDNPNLKIILTSEMDYTPFSIDTNYNRAYMYSLINNLPYMTVVPESYNTGIYKKTIENGTEFIDNRIFNVEYYTEEYLMLRKLYNKVYSTVLEQKILDDLPSSFDMGEATLFNGKKYAFLDEINSKGTIDKNSIIYVNTDANEIMNSDVEVIYFKSNTNSRLSINVDKAKVFDTPYNDIFIVNSNNNIIHTTYGLDVVTVNSGVNNTVIMHDLNDKQSEQHISVINNTDSLNAVILSYDSSLTNGPLKIKTNSGSEHYIVVFGNKTASLAGAVDVLHNDTLIKYEIIHSLISNFSELFETVNGHNIIFNESFIDDYINVTYSKFNLILDEHKNLGISQEHANYIISKITQYENDLNVGLSSYKDYINEKVSDFTNNNENLQLDVTSYINDLNSSTMPDSVKYIINRKVSFFKESIYSNNSDMLILKDLQTGNYNRLMSTLINDEDDNITVNNMYHKKETKNYVLTDVDGHMTYVWDGKYYENRMLDGIQVDKFYDNETSIGDLINYYEDNILVRSFISRNVSGSDGSDVIISSGNVYGQSNTYGITGNEALDDVTSRQNGNDILIGNNVYAYSGNNFIASTYNAYGGRGNDFIISWRNIYADQSYLYESAIEESSSSSNTLIQKGNGFINSSNGANTIITESDVSQINSTGGDVIISSSINTLIFGNFEAYEYYKQNQINYFGNHTTQLNNILFKFTDYQETGEFYNHYNMLNPVSNKIYINNGAVFAVIGKYDFIDTSLNTSESFVIGLGHNEMNITNNTNIYSQGDSFININGNNNYIKLGLNDEFSLNNSNNNEIYSRGYDNNVSLSNDYYELMGNQNKLYIGNSNSNIRLLGSNSTIVFSNNDKSNYITSTESGETTIKVGKQNRLEITAINKLKIEDGYVNILNVNTIEDVYTNNFSADSITIIGDLANTAVTFWSENVVSDVYVQAADIIGQLDNVKDVYLYGQLRFFRISGINANLQIDGFAEGVNNSMNEFSGIGNFIYNQKINTTGTSLFRFTDSNIGSYITNGNSNVQLVNSVINNLLVDGYKTMLSGKIHNVQIGNTNSFSIGATDNDTFNVNGTNLKLTASNSDSINVSYNYDYINSISGVGISSMTVDANSNYKFNFFITDSGKLLFNSGYFSGTLINVDETVVNVDKVRSGSSFDGENISVISESNLSLSIGFDIYTGYQKQINGITFIKLPDAVTIGSKTYTSNELNDIFSMLSSSIATNPKAILSELSVVINGIDNLYGSNGAVYDTNGYVVGNDNNNIIYLTKDRQYIVNAGKGDDIIDFGSASINYQQIMKYKQGDGKDIIKTTGDKILIQLTDISSSDIIFKPYIQNNNKNLQIYFKNDLIITLEGFSVADVQVQTTDKIYLKTEINSLINTIYGTDNGEIIDGLSTDTYIVAGKGNDTINFIGSNKNVLYYNRGDGVDTVNSISNFEIRFGSDILKNTIKYSKVSDNVYDIYLDAIKILTLNNTDKSRFVFSDGQVVDGAYINSYLSEQLGGKPFYDNGVYMGSDLPDYYDLSEGGSYHLKGNKGNDTFNFDGNSDHSILDYTEGDGIDTLNGYSKNVDINLINMSSEFLTSVYENGYLHLFYKGSKIMRIDDIDTANINIHMADKSFNQSDILIWGYGPSDTDNTDGDDVINNDPKKNNDIYAGKGNDIINLTSHPYYPNIINNIYYFEGDGHETINNDSRSRYTILLADTMLESDISYETTFENGQITLNILHKNVIIFTIPAFNNNDFTIDYLSSGNSVDMQTLFQELTTIIGTNGDDVITSDITVALIGTGDGNDIINISANTVVADIYAGFGDDIINLNNYGFNNINYNDGDGYDKIVLDNHENIVTLNLYDYNEVDIRFQYDLTNPNSLNIYNNDTKIITIENYIIDDQPFESMTIELNDNTLQSYDINDKVNASLQASRMLAESNINGLISIMAIDSNDVDSLGDGQTASTFLKKNE